MVSEDSEQFTSGFSPIHGLDDLRDLHETLPGLVSIFCHEFDAVCELLEVEPLGCAKRMLPKERNDPIQQILSATYGVAKQVLPVIV